MKPLSYGCFDLNYRHWVCIFFYKTLKIMSMFINVHSPYMFDQVGSYILQGHKSIDPIILFGQYY